VHQAASEREQARKQLCPLAKVEERAERECKYREDDGAYLDKRCDSEMKAWLCVSDVFSPQSSKTRARSSWTALDVE
jgi:hypothetical protein